MKIIPFNITTLTEINSWEEFFSHANTLPEKQKGDLFETLTQLILTTKPEYRSLLKHVWLQRESIPKEIRERINLPATDEGIDLVAETFTGEYWAIQCKFKGQNQTPTYKELSTFGNLANNYCRNISLTLLVHTGEKGVLKKKLLGENYAEIGLEFWLGLTAEDWERIHRKINGQSVRPTPRVPRQHQREAIRQAIEHFVQKDASRGRLIMPCGTGKSLTSYWIANVLEARTIIVAVPSLALIKQGLEDWAREFLANDEEHRPDWLVICSDESTANLDKDQFIAAAHSMGIPTTTDVEKIAAFITNGYEGKKVIFTTYQSSDRLIQAAKRCHATFDLAILDEAHKTVGVKSKTFAALLSEQNISIAKRIFMTATERVIRGSSDHEDVFSMHDEKVYGGLFYRLSFKDAIHAEPAIISDYKILTISVTSEEIRQVIRNNLLVSDTDKQLEEQESQSLAAAIALRKATQKYGIKHAISFHRSIKGADKFAELHRTLNQSDVDGVAIASSHISSKKSAGERARLMQDFQQEPLALMTNARCLTEGVDLPAIDCVLFADPKQSAIDIVQAAGRALRPYPGKEFGYIMLPLVVPDNQDFEEFSDSTPFRDVARIIAALSTQDEVIAEQFRIIRSGAQVEEGREQKIVIDGNVPVGMNLDLVRFADKIHAKIWERVARANWRPFEEARSFVHRSCINSQREWVEYCQTGKKPEDIPANPVSVYEKSWLNWGDWLGTGTQAPSDTKFRAFEEARSFVRTLKLRNKSMWSEYCQSGEKPKDIPTNPNNIYLGQGWSGYGDWLGTGTKRPADVEFRPFEEARSFVHGLHLKDKSDWRDYCKSGMRPKNIPSNPNNAYSNKGWSTWGDWLGTDTIAPQLIEYRSFEEAREYVHELHLSGVEQWVIFCKSGSKPKDIPRTPERVYKDEGWSGIPDWLGTDVIATTKRKYRSFENARAFAHELNLKNRSEWSEYCKTGKNPKDIPADPRNSYKGIGWSGWGDWLGTGTKRPSDIEFRPFEDARIFVHELNLKSKNEWAEYCRTGKRPLDIPGDPRRVYTGEGWLNWGDWLGTGTIAPFNRE